jgi:hypothetical protein
LSSYFSPTTIRIRSISQEFAVTHLSIPESPESLRGDWVTGASDRANSGRRRGDDHGMLKSNPDFWKCAKDVHLDIADRPSINTPRYWQEIISFRTAAIIGSLFPPASKAIWSNNVQRVAPPVSSQAITSRTNHAILSPERLLIQTAPVFGCLNQQISPGTQRTVVRAQLNDLSERCIWCEDQYRNTCVRCADSPNPWIRWPMRENTIWSQVLSRRKERAMKDDLQQKIHPGALLYDYLPSQLRHIIHRPPSCVSGEIAPGLSRRERTLTGSGSSTAISEPIQVRLVCESPQHVRLEWAST